MIFKATPDQLKQIILNAINASDPGGPQSMGWLSFENRKISMKEFEERRLYDFGQLKKIDIDYFVGRCVKIIILKMDKDLYNLIGLVDKTYQTWLKYYPTPKDLILSVPGTEIVEEITASPAA